MKIFGILPMAGKGSRIQPIAFSKELYPVAYRKQHFAISEFSIRGMTRAKVDEIKLVVHPDKSDIAKYYSQYHGKISIYFDKPKSLPESCLHPLFGIDDDDLCLFGLPDTLFMPADGYSQILKELQGGADISLGLFKVPDGSKYDSVAVEGKNKVMGVRVKKSPPLSNWIWGIWGANGKTLRRLKKIIREQKAGRGEKLLGVGFNTLAQQENVLFTSIKLGEEFFDIGTMDAIVKVGSVIDHFEF